MEKERGRIDIRTRERRLRNAVNVARKLFPVRRAAREVTTNRSRNPSRRAMARGIEVKSLILRLRMEEEEMVVEVEVVGQSSKMPRSRR